MEKYKSYFGEQQSPIKSAIGAGWAEILRNYTDSISIFRKDNRVLVAQDLNSAIELSMENKPVVLVVKGPRDVLWAKPIVQGKIIEGMFSGAWIYTSNNIVMKGYPYPIRLMDRVE